MDRKIRSKLLKKEVARLYNTSKETLRHYEDLGLITPEIDEKGYRLYGVEEMVRLRKIFMFKDLDISLEDMRAIMAQSVSKDKYLNLLNAHKEKLRDTIARYEVTLKNVERVLELSGQENEGISFKLTHCPMRYYLMFTPFETHTMDNLKSYYDCLQEVIESPYYSERELINIFKYDTLSQLDLKDSSICINVDQATFEKHIGSSRFNVKAMRAGTYLSVYYVFEEGQFDKLSDLKRLIDQYMKKNNLILIHDEVIEVEHPELSTHLTAESTIYEMQISVEKVNKKTIASMLNC